MLRVTELKGHMTPGSIIISDEIFTKGEVCWGFPSIKSFCITKAEILDHYLLQTVIVKRHGEVLGHRFCPKINDV